jgi:hypothetical protein
MLQRSVVMFAAWLEIIVGATFVAVPDLPCMLLLAAKPEGIGVPVARFAGFGLLALGVACLPAKDTVSPPSVVGLFVFNIGATILFAWVAMATTFHGFLLWPIVILHAAITIALVPQLLTIKGEWLAGFSP